MLCEMRGLNASAKSIDPGQVGLGRNILLLFLRDKRRVCFIIRPVVRHLMKKLLLSIIRDGKLPFSVPLYCSTVGISKYSTVTVYRLRVFDFLFK